MATQTQNPAYRPSAILLAVVALTLAADPCASADLRIRVALTRLFGGHASLQVRCPAGTCVSAGDSGQIVETDQWCTARCDGSQVVLSSGRDTDMVGGRVTVTPNSGALAVRIGDGRPATQYRGDLELVARNGCVQAINVLEMEQYLRGVVPMEIGGDAPAEAMKAQAVAARTFAMVSLGRYSAQGYDVTDTVMSQVYAGVGAERAGSDRAIADTAQMALVRGGRLVSVDYYDDCGGVTAAGSDPTDYPPSVEDRSPDGQDYCAAGRYHMWRLAQTANELAARLQSLRVGEITAIDATDRDATGRVRQVVVTGSLGVAKVAGARFRALLGYERLRSTWFTVGQPDDNSFEFTGRGNGHGHGMCQAGAIGMAKSLAGCTFIDILTHYFPGCQVGRVEDRVRSVAASRSWSVRRKPGVPLKRDLPR